MLTFEPQAGGRVGGAFAQALLATGKHTVTALTRTESRSSFPAGLRVVRADYSSLEALEAALRGQQVLIITLSVFAPAETHSLLVQAAGRAGVPYVIPNAYGSDIANPALVNRVSGSPVASQGLANCEEVRAAGATYICVVCGFWVEWSLALGENHFGFDIKNRSVTFFDDGETKVDVSTWEQCGRAISALLSLPEQGPGPAVKDWADKPIYFDSYCVSQRDMLDSLHRVLGTTDGDWTIRKEPSGERYDKGIEAMKRGDRNGFARSLYARIFYPNGDGNFGRKRGLANEVLGLPKEDLDDAVRRAVDMVESDYKPFPDM